MENNFKLTLQDFIEVPEADRVKGKGYWVADGVNTPEYIDWYHSLNYSMDAYGNQRCHWQHWYTLRFDPNDLGQFFEWYQKHGSISCTVQANLDDYRRYCESNRCINKLPTLTIPEQTEAERVEYLKAELDKLQPAPEPAPANDEPWKPQFGEVCLVGDWEECLEKRIFIEMDGDRFKCVNRELDSDNALRFKEGESYDTVRWSICRRLNGEIITPTK
jgi:hypothetical protein